MSNRSDNFAKWIEELNPDKIRLLIELEKHTRVMVHDLDLMGEISPPVLHNVARASKKLQEAYENPEQ